MQKFVLLLISVSFLASGCSTKVTRYQQSIDGNAMDFSKVDTMKKGKACLGTRVFDFVIGGNNNSASAAAKNGDISIIKHVEQEFIISPFGSKNCTIVYGE